LRGLELVAAGWLNAVRRSPFIVRFAPFGVARRPLDDLRLEPRTARVQVTRRLSTPQQED